MSLNKYLAFDLDTKEIFKPTEIILNNEDGTMEILRANDQGIDDVRSAILMHWTGLFDINGKEIYEGQILRMTENPESNQYLQEGESPEDKTVKIGPVVFSDTDGFQFLPEGWLGRAPKSDRKGSTSRQREYEVIGNIYQNPELLK